MPSLLELVERVNKGETVPAGELSAYESSANSAEKFLSHHAHATLDLRTAQQHILKSLEAIDFGDLKVLNQYISICSFLGLDYERIRPIVRFGTSAIARGELALGIEAIQYALGLDRQGSNSLGGDWESRQYVASQYDRSAHSAAWKRPDASSWNNRQTRIAYIASRIADDEPSTHALTGFAQYHDAKRFRPFIYTTEAGVRRDKQQFAQPSYVAASSRRGGSALELFSTRKVQAWIAPTDGDCLSAAIALADQLVKDQIDVAVFDADPGDPIASVVASWNVAKVKINLCRGTPIMAPGIQSVVYADSTKWEADSEWWTSRGVDSRFIFEGYNLDEPLGATPHRSVYGIPESAIVLATSGNELDHTLTSEWVDAVINVLGDNPNAIYLLIGEGDLAWQKRSFESAGVSKRVGYAGRRRDPGFLRICDIYLAEFPNCTTLGAIQAMSLEKPVVTIGPDSAAAALVGSGSFSAAPDASQFVERVGQLIHEPLQRQHLGRELRLRVEENFSFRQTVGQFEHLFDQLLQSRSISQTPPGSGLNVLAEVA